jgi:hypothetical protein
LAGRPVPQRLGHGARHPVGQRPELRFHTREVIKPRPTNAAGATRLAVRKRKKQEQVHRFQCIRKVRISATENPFRSPFVIPAKAGIHEHRRSSLNHDGVHGFRIKSGMTIKG